MVADGVFENLSNLMFLKLATNRIQAITSLTFRGLSGLASLELENNNIRSIPANAFSNISILHLYNNKISIIDPHAFAGADVTVVTLHENKLTSVPWGVFHSLTNLNHLDLSNNPWKCDCSITWLKVWLGNRSPNFVLDNACTTRCEHPLNVQGMLLLLYLTLRYNDCKTITTEMTHLEPSTASIPQLSIAATFQTSTTAVTLDNMTTVGTENQDGSNNPFTGIIVGCVFVVFVIIIGVAIFMYCRYKKYASWSPNTDQLDGNQHDMQMI